MTELYCLYRTEYNDDGYLIFTLIGAYTDRTKLLEDSKLLWTIGIREPSHHQMCEMNKYIVETTRSQCWTTCRFPGESRLAGYIIEKCPLNIITNLY